MIKLKKKQKTMKFSKKLLLNLIRESFHRGKVTKYFTTDEHFHLLLMYHALSFPTCIFTLYFLCLSFPFSSITIDQFTASAFNRMIHLCFRKKSLIGQLNVQDKLQQLKRKINIP